MLLGMSFGVATGVGGVGNEVGEGLERSLDRSGTSLGSGEGANEVGEGVDKACTSAPGPDSTRSSCVTGSCIVTE
jgi:hypothetical protein